MIGRYGSFGETLAQIPLAQSMSAADKALTFFHQANAALGEPAASQNLAQFLAYVEAQQPGWKKTFGEGIVLSELPDAQIKSGMQALAAKYAGKLPDRRGLSKFFDALIGRALSISYQAELTTSAVKEGIAEAGGTLKKLAFGGAALYISVAAAGLGLFLWQYLKSRKASS